MVSADVAPREAAGILKALGFQCEGALEAVRAEARQHRSAERVLVNGAKLKARRQGCVVRFLVIGYRPDGEDTIFAAVNPAAREFAREMVRKGQKHLPRDLTGPVVAPWFWAEGQ